MLEKIIQLSAIQIIKETKTQGSSPILIRAEDDREYFVKASPQAPVKMELINELICTYFLKCWNLYPPDIALIRIDKDVLQQYQINNPPLSNRYKSISFEKEILFGSKRIKPVIELDRFIKKVDKKRDFNQFRAPLDIIKIGVFDKWIANKDRKLDNPNILIGSQSHLEFHPIDHSAAWAYISHPKEITHAKLYLEEKFRILNAPLIKSIAKFAKPEDLKNLQIEIDEGIHTTIENLDFIFEQVPKEWGFSSKGKLQLKNILSDEQRNKETVKFYLSYIK